MKNVFIVALLLLSSAAFAGTVDTVSIYSNSMKKNIKAVVIKPDNYKKEKAFPTVYLLHGYSGAFDNWIRKVPQLKQYVDQYQVLIVCPDGAYGGWYFDSPIDSTMRYETFIAKEVPAFVDKNYKTIKDRKGRVITGLSMGGHGGLFLGFRHADFFGGCGSMSGALAIDLITDKRYGIGKILGDTTNRKYYRHSIFNEMENYPKDSLAIIIDCGIDDFIFQMSKMAHEKMLQLKIPHEYIERPGKHDWNYWANAVQYQLLYFRNYFDKALQKK